MVDTEYISTMFSRIVKLVHNTPFLETMQVQQQLSFESG